MGNAVLEGGVGHGHEDGVESGPGAVGAAHKYTNNSATLGALFVEIVLFGIISTKKSSPVKG